MVKANKWYAVKCGRKAGIYESWGDCQQQVNGFPGARYKGFTSREEAQQYMNSSPVKASPTQLKLQSSQRTQTSTICTQIASAEPFPPESSMRASESEYYVVEFHGATTESRTFLKSPDGTVVCHLLEPVAGSTFAEYRGLNFGLSAAASRGFQRIIVRGFSTAVCGQLKGNSCTNEGLRPLWEKAKALQSQFLDFKIEPAEMEYNPGAANGGFIEPPARQMNRLDFAENNYSQNQVHSLSSQMRPPFTSSHTSRHENAVPDGLYVVEFDGASKGNPGKAGAGALLKSPDGTIVLELCEGLGIATNNVAEYRGLILGLRAAEHRGVQRILIKGDSKLVCEQVLGNWAVRNEGLKPLFQECKFLQSKFREFKVQHVEREFNPRADVLANLGVSEPESVWSSLIP